MRVAAELCGVSQGGQRQKATWWWNELVEKLIKEKRVIHKKWQTSVISKSKELYLAKKEGIKRAVGLGKKVESKKIADELKQNKFCLEWYE